MPIISCSSCKSRFKVKIQTIGKVMDCPKCGHSFKAVAMHSAPRKQHGIPPIGYAAMAVGAIALAIVIKAVSSADKPKTAAEIMAAKEADAASNEPAEIPKKPKAEPEVYDPKAAMAKRATDVLNALKVEDDPMLPGWVDFARMYALRQQEGLEDRNWSDLDPELQHARRVAMLESLLGDAETREFTRLSMVESVEVERIGPGKSVVAARYKNPLLERTQDVTLKFAASAGAWKLVRMDRADIAGGPAAPEDRPDGPPPSLSDFAGTRSVEGEVETVDLLTDVPPTTTRDIQSEMGKLLDLSQTVGANRARQKLAGIGKPAIPHLMNALVPLDLERNDDLLIGVRISNTLRDITGMDFPIVPGSNEGSMMGETRGDNDTNRRRWFGWWRLNKESFVEAVAPSFEDEEDDDGDQ